MNIKEIIDKERWEKNYHNAALDRIEANVTEYVAELEAAVNMYKQSLKTQTAYTDNATKAAMVLKDDAEQRIAELERDTAELEYALKTYESAMELKDKRIEKLYERIAELKEQLPKVIEPKNGTCMCGNIVRGFDPVHYGWKNNYCPNCGAKLKWRDA